MQYGGSRRQNGIVCLRIVTSGCRKDCVVRTFYACFRIDCGDMCARIVIKFFGKHPVTVFGIHENHIILKPCKFCGRRIFSVSRCQNIDVVLKLSATGIPPHLYVHVIVKTVCGERYLRIFKRHLLTRRTGSQHSLPLSSVIKQFVGIYEKGIALFHLYMSECVKRIALREIICRITIHPHSSLTEHYITLHNLFLLEIHRRTEQGIRIFKKDLVFLIPVGRGYCRLNRLCRSRTCERLRLFLFLTLLGV